MKRAYILLLIITFLSACKNQKKTADINKSSDPIYSLKNAFAFQGEAMKVFNTDPIAASTAFKKAATAYVQNAYFKDAGICFGNLAHIYEEKFNKLDSAYLISKMALDYAVKANDTLNTGHCYRYTGYLLGMKGSTDDGIAMIEKSKPYYTLRNNKDALAVADYDKARVYAKAKQYDKATQSFDASTNYFKEKMNLQRIFNNNLFALKMYRESGNKTAYDNTKSENDNLLQSGKISDALKSMYSDALKN